MKRNLAILFAVLGIFFFSLLPLSAEAVDSGPCGDSVNYTLDKDGVLSITGYGNMNAYLVSNWDNGQQPPWYQDRALIKTVIIGNGVSTVGGYAFYGCSNLKSVSMPDSISLIDEYAFSGCTGLATIDIPSKVSSIGDRAFSGCTSLTDFTIPDKVEMISQSTFYNCSGLKSIHIPTSVTYIDKDAFTGCSSLKNVYYSGTQEEWNQIEKKERGSP